MFLGTVNGSALQTTMALMKDWDCQNVYIGCSGNFTFERTITNAFPGKFSLYSNDVSLYTGVMGHFMANKPFPVTVSDDYMDEFGWLLKYMNTPIETIATVRLLLTYLDFHGKTTLYHTRMQEAHLNQWDAMHAKDVLKLENLKKVKLKDYYHGDVVEHLANMPDNQGFLSFPPFWSGGYERLYKMLHKILQFPKPEYEIFTTERRKAMFENLFRKKHWMLGVDSIPEELEDYIVGSIKPTSRSKEWFIFSNTRGLKVVRPRLQTKPYFGEKLKAGEEIGDKITFEVLEPQKFQAIKTQYLDIKIAPASVNKAVGVRVDDKLIGCFAVTDSSIPTTYANLEPPYGYLLSDFSISGTSYKHLSKLVLYAILSHEAKGLIERMMNKRVTSVVTTIFTNRPKSMKYRGLFEQISKKDGKPGVDAHKYILNYGARLGQWSLEEAMKEWKAKYGEKV